MLTKFGKCTGGLVLVFMLIGHARAEVAASAGHLAVRQDGGRWQVLCVGDSLPQQAELRTSAAGAVAINLEDARLVIAADTHLHVDQSSRVLQIETGRVSLDAQANWNLTASDAALQLPPEAKAGISVRGGKTNIDLFEKSITVRASDTGHVTYEAPLSVSIDGDQQSTSVPDDVEAWKSRANGWTDVRQPQGLGQLLVNDPQSNSPTRMEIARCHVNVVLQPPVALVQLDQSFYNPADGQQEGTFVFNLPQGASISRFAMFVTHDELIEGELIERKRASGIYESIVRRRRDPAILEQIGDNLFRMRVFPIFARDTKRILLDFTVPVVERSGRYRFDLPLLSDLKPIGDFKITGTISGPVDPASARSHLNPQLTFTPEDGGGVRFSSEQKNVHPPARLDIEYRAPSDAQPRLSRFVTRDGTFGDEEQYFVASIPKPDTAAAQPVPSDLMIVLDTSGSSKNLSIIKQAARTILSNLGPEDRFQVACADEALRRLTTQWQSPKLQSVTDVLAQIDRQFPLGSSRLDQTLNDAVRVFSESPDARRRQLVYLGDGEARGQLDGRTNWIWRVVPNLEDADIAFSPVPVGNSPQGRRYLKTAARRTGGRAFPVMHPRDLEELFVWTLAGCPTGRRIGEIRVADEPDAEVFADPSFSDGQSLYLYGFCRPRDVLTLTAAIDGQPREYVFTDENSSTEDTAVFAGRLWAQRKLEALRSSADEPSKAEREAIVRLSQEWSLLSPFTAFLVLESEADYQRWRVDRRLRRRYWKPPEALAAIPLPIVERPEQTEADEPGRRERRQDRRPISREQFEATIKAAQTALQQNKPALALRRLLALRSDAEQFGAEEFRRLLADTEQRLQHEQLLDELGVRRRQFDLAAPLPLPSTDLFASLLGAGGISDEFIERQPLARTMLKRVTPPQREIPLTGFLDFVRCETGWNLIADEIALADVGIPLDEPIDLRHFQDITVRNLLFHVLQPLALTSVSTPHLVTVTTAEVSANMLETHVYPVSDLVRTDELPRPSLLSSPFRDLDRDFERRVETGLDRTVSVDLKNLTLSQFAGWLREQLDANVRLDKVALTDVGIPPEEPLRPLKLNRVPLRLVVDTVLQDLDLECQPHREVVEITTVEAAENTLETRCYSAVGVVFQFPDDLSRAIRERQNRIWGNTWGGGGGGFGGGIGGGGFGIGGGGIELGGGIALGGDLPETDSASTEDAGMSLIAGPDTGEASKVTTDETAVESAVEEATASPIQTDETANDAEPVFDEPDVLDGSDASGMNQDLPGGGGTGFSSDEVSWMLLNETEGPWIEIDGIGGDVQFYEPAMSIVVRQTNRVHRQVAEQLQMLRDLPVAGRRIRPAHIPKVTEDMAAGWDLDPLISLIQIQTEGPWRDYDGIGGSVSPHLPSMSLIIRQTPRGHEELYDLLTQLRRTKIINRHRLAEWRDNRPTTEGLTFGPQMILTTWPKLPMPQAAGTDEELELLKVRHVEPSFASSWRNIVGGAAQDFRVRKNGPRLELKFDHVELRSDGHRGSVRYPGLTRVEIDNWGETIRRMADAALPWLPHVSNEELAALYEVSLVAESDTEVTLRLVDSRDSRLTIRATFDRESRLPTGWDASIAGTPAYRLVFDRTEGSETVLAVDADGREIARWKLNQTSLSIEIPPIEDRGPNDLVIDRRQPSGTFRQIHAALIRYDYQAAAGLLDEALGEQPRQPLLNFLLAWTLEHAGNLLPDSRRREREALSVVVASQAADLISLIRAENFRGIDDGELLTLLEKIPEKERSLSALDALIELSTRQGMFGRALEHLEQALGQPGGSNERRQLLKVALLLKAGAIEQAQTAAGKLTGDGSAEAFAKLGDLFGQQGDLETSTTYFDLSRERSLDDRRRLQAITLRQVSWHQGERRWELILDAAEFQPGDSPFYNSVLLKIVHEAQTAADAEILGRLATRTRRPAFRAHLLMRQAQLTTDAEKAARLCRELLTSDAVPPSEEQGILRKLIESQDAEFVIDLLESRLRNGKALDDAVVRVLALAYEETGRPELALRATSELLEQRPSWDRTRGNGFF